MERVHMLEKLGGNIHGPRMRERLNLSCGILTPGRHRIAPNVSTL